MGHEDGIFFFLSFILPYHCYSRFCNQSLLKRPCASVGVKILVICHGILLAVHPFISFHPWQVRSGPPLSGSTSASMMTARRMTHQLRAPIAMTAARNGPRMANARRTLSICCTSARRAAGNAPHDGLTAQNSTVMQPCVKAADAMARIFSEGHQVIAPFESMHKPGRQAVTINKLVAWGRDCAERQIKCCESQVLCLVR